MCEKLCKFRMGGYERRVFDCILRQTMGWAKKEDYISLGQFEEKTGIAQSNVSRALKNLEAMRLITVRRGPKRGRKFAINFDVNQWIEKGEELIKNDNDTDDQMW